MPDPHLRLRRRPSGDLHRSAERERGEGYSPLGGFFRQYGLVYIAADERDVIRVRTNYRKDPPEDVYLFRLEGSIENGRRVFLDYMGANNEPHERPRFCPKRPHAPRGIVAAELEAVPGHLNAALVVEVGRDRQDPSRRVNSM